MSVVVAADDRPEVTYDDTKTHSIEITEKMFLLINFSVAAKRTASTAVGDTRSRVRRRSDYQRAF
jgi:hypothetical protein